MDEYTHYFSYLQETQKFLIGDMKQLKREMCMCVYVRVGDMTISKIKKKLKPQIVLKEK